MNRDDLSDFLYEHGADLTVAVRSLAVESARVAARFPTIGSLEEAAVKWSRLGDLLEGIRRDLDRDRHPSGTVEDTQARRIPDTIRLAPPTFAVDDRVRLHSGAHVGQVAATSFGDRGEYVLVDWPVDSSSWHYARDLVAVPS